MRENAPPRQLAFDLPLDPRYGREDFLVGPANEAAYALVEAWPDWPDSVLVLTGSSGSGKSHLAAIWAERAHAWTAAASEIGADAVQHLVSNGALVIEDVDRAENRDEAALFHLLNRARERAWAQLQALAFRQLAGEWRGWERARPPTVRGAERTAAPRVGS